MAGSLRAALVLAALAPTVSGKWQLVEEFNDTTCATSTSLVYTKTPTCVSTDGSFFSSVCESGKIKHMSYSDSACATLAASQVVSSTCTIEVGGKSQKTSCVDKLPATMVGVDVTWYGQSNDCTGDSMDTAMVLTLADLGACKDDDGKGRIRTVTAAAVTTKTYTAADCSGTPSKTEVIPCGDCSPQTDFSMRFSCEAMQALAAQVSHATGLAVSKAAAVAFASMVAFLA